MQNKNLILVHCGGQQEQDFIEICNKIHTARPDIYISLLPFYLKSNLDSLYWNLPTLTVSVASELDFNIKRGPILTNRRIEKLEQQAIFMSNGIPTPYGAVFDFGMPLDSKLYGEFVILKPINLDDTSQHHHLEKHHGLQHHHQTLERRSHLNR